MRKPYVDGGIANKLNAKLTQNVSKVITAFESDVEAAKSQIECQLEEMAIEFGRPFDVVENAYVRPCPEEADTSLRERMSEYNREVTTNIENLDMLWRQWTTVQHSIAEVAVEIAGTIETDHGDLMTDDLCQVIAKAKVSNEQWSTKQVKASDKLSQLQTDISNLCDKSIEESKEHLKEVQFARRRQFDQINAALKSGNL